MEVSIRHIEDAAEIARTDVRIAPGIGVRVLSDNLSAAMEFVHELALSTRLQVADLAERSHDDGFGVIFPSIIAMDA